MLPVDDFASQLASTLVGMALILGCSPSWAQTAGEPGSIVVEATADAAAALAARRVSDSDTASLLAGVDSAQAGGVSSLPMLHGLGDDRIRILVNGVPIAAACPMHMNPPLSYFDPANVSRVDVMPGVTPESLAGDNYRDGSGERINASRYETSNQQITAAYRRPSRDCRFS